MIKSRITSGGTSEVLSAKGVDLSYGSTTAVRDAHLTLARGEIAAITGASGSGKSSVPLRLVQCTQVVLPLAVGLLLALVAGKLAESAYLVTGGGETFWDGAGVPLLVAAMAGVLVLAGTLPLVGRRIDPELIRRD